MKKGSYSLANGKVGVVAVPQDQVERVEHGGVDVARQFGPFTRHRRHVVHGDCELTTNNDNNNNNNEKPNGIDGQCRHTRIEPSICQSSFDGRPPFPSAMRYQSPSI